VRQAMKDELHQISVDAARAVLHERNLGQLVEHATRRLVGERFADPVVAAAALEPLRPDITDLAETTARATATTTAGTMVDVVREDVELARAEVVGLVREATDRTNAALRQARTEVEGLAREATAKTEAALGPARAEMEELSRAVTARTEAALAEARAEVTELASGATAKADSAVAAARQEVAELAAKATETAQHALGEVRQLAESTQHAAGEAREEVRRFAGEATEAARSAAGVAQEQVRRLVEEAAAKAQHAVGGAQEELRRLVGEASAKAEAVVEKARAEVVELAREAAEKAAAEYIPRPVEVTMPNGTRHQVAGFTHEVLPELLLALGARCHVLLVGPAGTGKSMLAAHAAQALGLELQAISLGPTTPMSKVFGYYDAHGNYHDTPFRRAFEHGGVMLLDELDNGHPGLLAELNQALALGVCAFADTMVTAHPDFRLVATGNTYGTGGDRQYVGRQALDAATLDRFVTIEVEVDEKLEESVAFGLAPAKKPLVRELLVEVRRLREVAAGKQLPVMFSPRMSYDGARLLAAGATLEQVMSWRVVRGLSSAHRATFGLDA
jgi:MoxR-like ATPase